MSMCVCVYVSSYCSTIFWKYYTFHWNALASLLKISLLCVTNIYTFFFWIPYSVSLIHVPAKLIQSCLTLCDSMDYSPPGSSVHGILQARILEWVAMSSSRESSWPRGRSLSLFKFPALAGGFFMSSTTWEALHVYLYPNYHCLDCCSFVSSETK